MTVDTAVAATCLVPQETADWRKGGGAGQLVLHNAWSTDIISPELGRAASSRNCFLGSKAPSTGPSSGQSAHFHKGREILPGPCSNVTSLERPILAIQCSVTTFTLGRRPLSSFSALSFSFASIISNVPNP